MAMLSRWTALRRSFLLTILAYAVFAIIASALLEGRAQAENCISSYPANSLDRKACLCRQFLSRPSAPGCRRTCGPSTGYQPKESHCGPLAQDASRSSEQSQKSGPRPATSKPPPKSSDNRAPSMTVPNPELTRKLTGTSTARSKPGQQPVGSPQQGHPRANANNAQGPSCVNVDPQTGHRCITPPGSPVVDMNTTLSDGTRVVRFNWRITNVCTRDIQVTVKQDNGSTPKLVSGKNSWTFYCLSVEGCHKFTGYSEKCRN